SASRCGQHAVGLCPFFFQAEDGIRDRNVTGVQTCALPISHPSIAALEELSRRAEDLQRAKTANEVLISDIRRELTKAETDVEQVATRADRDKKRLEAGSGSAKDLQALASEVESLAKRQSDLEEVQLEVMERMDTAQSEAGAIAEQSEALDADIQRTTAERAQALAELDAEIEENQAKRAIAAEGIDENLTQRDEPVRSKPAGRAAVARRGTLADAVQPPRSLTEKEAIAKADPDEVIRSEDYDYVLVRVE